MRYFNCLREKRVLLFNCYCKYSFTRKYIFVQLLLAKGNNFVFWVLNKGICLSTASNRSSRSKISLFKIPSSIIHSLPQNLSLRTIQKLPKRITLGTLITEESSYMGFINTLVMLLYKEKKRLKIK